MKLLNEEEFQPTFINTVVFLHSIIGQTIVFLFNYGVIYNFHQYSFFLQGKPFMESLSQNKKYLKILLFSLGASLLMALNISEDISDFMNLNFKGVPGSVNLLWEQ